MSFFNPKFLACKKKTTLRLKNRQKYVVFQQWTIVTILEKVTKWSVNFTLPYTTFILTTPIQSLFDYFGFKFKQSFSLPILFVKWITSHFFCIFTVIETKLYQSSLLCEVDHFFSSIKVKFVKVSNCWLTLLKGMKLTFG